MVRDYLPYAKRDAGCLSALAGLAVAGLAVWAIWAAVGWCGELSRAVDGLRIEVRELRAEVQGLRAVVPPRP